MAPILEAKRISKHFGGLKAIDDVDMSIPEGQIFGIIGPNGAGKTTFFNVCSGVFKPTSGQIIYRGRDITGLPPEKIARMGIARTFQNIQLFRYMTVLENVKIGFHIRTKTGLFGALVRGKRFRDEERMIEEEAGKILQKVGLAKYSDTLASNLPYGLQRKVEIARALALKPKVILLDEPVAGMNPLETQSLSDFIKSLNAEGYTIVVIEHDMKFVMGTCDSILVLNFGQKICEGSPAAVRADKGVNEAYFGKGLVVAGGAR